MADFAAVILAGGAGRRMGGRSKPLLPVAGVPMVTRVLDAVAGADPRVVVGPADLDPLLPAGVLRTVEQPPGGGPVAGCAAGLSRTGSAPLVALLAADLPMLTPAAVGMLLARAEWGDTDGVLFVDGTGHRQLLCGMWRAAVLRSRLAALGDPAGAPMRTLVAGTTVAEIHWPSAAGTPAPWYDCDTRDDLRTAEDWHAGTG